MRLKNTSGQQQGYVGWLELMLSRINWRDLAFVLVLLASSALSWWKASKGFANIDESFYLTIPQRILQGDALLRDEWHVSQFAGILLLPIVAVYQALVHSNEGIAFAFRHIYIFAQAAFCIYLYLCLREKKWGLAAVLPFTLFVPFNIMALSYNSMGVQFLTVALATMTLDRPNRGLMFLAGLFFAAAVLCCPYLVALYPVYLLVYIISSIRRARGKEKQRTPELRTDFFLCFTAGCAVLGIATMLLLFQSSLSEIIAAMPGIFSDNSHPQSSLLDKINSYLAAVLSSNPVAKFVIAALTALLLAWVIDVKWLKRRGQDLIFVLSLLICGINMLCFFRGMKFINFCFFPLMFAGLFAFITDRERNWRLFCFFWLPALAYSFCIHLGSNQGVYAISNALAVQSVSSILLIGCRFKHLTPVSAKLSSALAVLLVGTCCFALVYCRAQYCFWDEPVSELNCWIGYGSNAGQWTTEERYQVYEQLVNDTQLVREQEGKVLYYSKDTCLYLMDDKEMAAYSAWLAIDYANNSEWQRLLLYYELNPDKLPDCIYLSKAIDLRPQQLLDDLEMTGEVVEGTFGWSLLNLSHLP